MTRAHGTAWLFVPGSRPDRYPKAAASGADQVILDLEDSVADAAKEHARRAVLHWLSHGNAGWVRLNATGSKWHAAELDELVGAPGLRGLMLPKAEPDAVARTAERLGGRAALIALVETAVGLASAQEIARLPGVDRLAFGSLDYALDVGCEHSEAALLFARSALVVASRVHDLPPPLDGVTTALDDDDAVRRAAEHARSLGFGGKLCVHPRQVGLVRSVLSVSEDEVRWAHRVLAAAATGDVVEVDGQMVDRPVVARAAALLDRVRRTEAEADERHDRAG